MEMWKVKVMAVWLLVFIFGVVAGWFMNTAYIANYRPTAMNQEQAYNRILRARDSHIQQLGTSEDAFARQVMSDYDSVLDWIEKQ